MTIICHLVGSHPEGGFPVVMMNRQNGKAGTEGGVHGRIGPFEQQIIVVFRHERGVPAHARGQPRPSRGRQDSSGAPAHRWSVPSVAAGRRPACDPAPSADGPSRSQGSRRASGTAAPPAVMRSKKRGGGGPLFLKRATGDARRHADNVRQCVGDARATRGRCAARHGAAALARSNGSSEYGRASPRTAHRRFRHNGPQAPPVGKRRRPICRPALSSGRSPPLR